MSIKEVIQKFIDEKILIYVGSGKIELDSKYVPEIYKTSKPDKIEKIEDLLQDYAKVFPKGIKSGNRLVKRSVNSLRGKMIAFKNKRKDITAHQILEAAEYYVKEAKKRNYEFMICSDYLIMKNGSSELESIIDMIKDGDVKVDGKDNLTRDLN